MKFSPARNASIKIIQGVCPVDYGGMKLDQYVIVIAVNRMSGRIDLISKVADRCIFLKILLGELLSLPRKYIFWKSVCEFWARFGNLRETPQKKDPMVDSDQDDFDRMDRFCLSLAWSAIYRALYFVVTISIHTMNKRNAKVEGP
ncbi:hypothetical protein [Thalassospira profundimaris]|uniref:Uncharacterized protein n=1 Tax=Thalassospira profundimaris TaxID=502049 RepID=A0A367WZU9_9PROT|nr:hypothetical protein [Thalassospira profundimaris]RCK46759.1 hypothetical protein TH30_09235 [Thalassospira profundimaris]